MGTQRVHLLPYWYPNDAAARAMIEAATYLGFIVGDFRASGTVDFALTQFASRELNRAASGAGGTPLNC